MMQTQTIEILNLERESFSVEATVIGRFAVHHVLIGSDINEPDIFDDSCFNITHIPTGRAITGKIYIHDYALSFAQALEGGIDEELIQEVLKGNKKARTIFHDAFRDIRNAWEIENGYLYAREGS